jgi:hypothetical protein
MSKYSAKRPEREGLYIMSSRGTKSRPRSPGTAAELTAGPVVVPATTGVAPMEIEPLVADDEDVIMGAEDGKDARSKERIVLFGGRVSLTRRQAGILGAVINGGWGGLNLIPLHYALQDQGLTGAGYLISYAGGSLIVNTGIWVIFYLYYLHQKKDGVAAFECLPKFHFDKLGGPGLMAGTLYSIGNFTAILAVTYLGQGTGYSFCQMQLFVSGLWGVFYFREIQGAETISLWFLSATVALIGIIWLSYEHEGTSTGHRRTEILIDSILERFSGLYIGL